jgi:hypothetical protein
VSRPSAQPISMRRSVGELLQRLCVLVALEDWDCVAFCLRFTACLCGTFDHSRGANHFRFRQRSSAVENARNFLLGKIVDLTFCKSCAAFWNRGDIRSLDNLAVVPNVFLSVRCYYIVFTAHLYYSQ